MQLTPRAQAVLYAVMTEFIETGEPVGSRTLTRKYGFDLSAATIRNVLSDLEHTGYLVQPHTSAGRVPTETAFRLFVDALMNMRELSDKDTLQIQSLFKEIEPGSDLLSRTGKLLAELSGVPAILLRARSDQRVVLKIRFIPTRPGELLSVIVLSDGSVENRFIKVDSAMTDSELERVHNLLEELTGGVSLTELRNRVVNVFKEQHGALVALRNFSLKLLQAALDGTRRTTDLVIEGRAHLLDRPEFAKADQMRELMRALEDRERLISLLDRTLESGRVQVFLGEETARTVGYPVSVVAAAYQQEGGQPGGALGVIGPTRMDYPFLVPLIDATAKAMSRAITQTAAVSEDDSGATTSEKT